MLQLSHFDVTYDDSATGENCVTYILLQNTQRSAALYMLSD